MTDNVVTFPRSPIVVPHALFDESRAFTAAMELRHRQRWYDMGVRVGFLEGLLKQARADGAEFRVAYAAGCIAITFGVDLSECVS